MNCRRIISIVLTIIFASALHAEESDNNITLRGSYWNSALTFQTTGKGRVAFMGGSITEMEGYRPMVCRYLQKTFPKTQFEFIAAGISSTCSDTGAFRLESDVLSKGEIDLFFLEFAVNDNQDGRFSQEHSLRSFEGIVRHIRTVCPKVDIVITFFANESMIEQYRRGEIPDSIAAHTKVARQYDISTINLAREVQRRIDAGTLTWRQYGGVHPAEAGNRICAEMIESLLNAAWDKPGEQIVPHALPKALDAYSYSRGAFLDFNKVERGAFQFGAPDWKSIPGALRSRFNGEKLLYSVRPGDSCSFEFSGSVVGLYVLAGPDAGAVDYSIDGGEYKTVQLYHDYSAGLHYPRTVILADQLSPGVRQAVLRVSKEKDSRSSGTAVRILKICVQNMQN